MPVRSFFLFLIFILLSPCSLGQLSAADVPQPQKSVFKFSTVEIAGVVTLTAIMFHYDQEIYDGLYDWKMNNRVVKKVSPVITDLGDGAFSAGLFGGFIGYGLVFKSDKAYEVGKIGLESFLLTGITVQIFKHLCGRERPSASTRSGGTWHGPFSYIREPKGSGRGIASFDAFPSGHTATVFAAATTIADFYPEPWVSYSCYSLAALTAISRVTESTHWISDCFIGALIGHYGTKFVEKMNYGYSDVTLLPFIAPEQYGIALAVKL